MSTLTERYIFAVTRTLGPDAVADVRAELEASIGDAVEARIDGGEEAVAAERTVLTELGDPGVLAAGYADRRLQLIGPRYYLIWRRLLRLLLIIVPVAAAGGVALGAAIEGDGIGDIVGQAIAVGISAIVHVAFWLTLVFAILERTGADPGLSWDVDQLPTLPVSTPLRQEATGSLVFLGVCALALIADQLVAFVHFDGTAFPILAPALWPWQIGAFLVLILAEAALIAAVLRRGAWSVPLAVVNTAIAVVFASLALTLLARGELINPELLRVGFAENGVTPDTVRILGIVTGFAVLGVAATDIAGGWIRAARANRA